MTWERRAGVNVRAGVTVQMMILAPSVEDAVNARFGITGSRAAAGAVAGMAGLVCLVPSMAQATPSVGPATRAQVGAAELPPVGEVDYEPLAGDFEFTLKGQTCRAHVAGSVEEDVVAQDAAHRADTVAEKHLRMRGRETCGSGRASGGSITIEQNDVDVDPKSLLRLTQRFPPKFEQVMVLSFTMVIDQPERAAAEPLVLTTRAPAKLIGSLTEFPPKGDVYQLQNPVDLIDLENPDTTVATIQKFPVKVGGL
ncbi:hypothetical protein FNV62_07165 [Streptomyces sp. RLB3-17]|uniref:hypothetical protein n=1 Tax=unclassified Streptomyces TaxID=2593676 RepID=UPI001164B910|nr:MULTISPECIES: hypothetical protein [unclassified Streptomyces]NMI55960.1 hypothetical protein [Streptomyces sp. RLA2-12]QDN55419.1 hypothetical protein FNV67_08935 [Streptomyces sp. S1D4-20]QDN65597.1 hypothetical protein FNV66_08530 [Streptomyces sp. S1D4-14]QDN96240.1 hypothetical protein FNV58_09670 [Streptomyces sp. RLB1-9]QDO17949.1 hypothetical protein FNV65_08120 [Streptomyces sp. S1A1-8]